MSDWIKCSEQMPTSYTPVRIKTLHGRTGIMYRAFRWKKAVGFGEFRISEVRGDMVTHWQPLPPPEEECPECKQIQDRKDRLRQDIEQSICELMLSSKSKIDFEFPAPTEEDKKNRVLRFDMVINPQ